LRVLIVGSGKKWGMERSTQRALARDRHTARLFDPTRSRHLLGAALTQRRALAVTRKFSPDLVLLGDCRSLAVATVQEMIAGRPSTMWYHDAPSYRNAKRPDIAHVVAIGKLADSFFVSGFVDEWNALGVRAKFLPSCADKELGPTKPIKRFASDVVFIGSGSDRSRANFLTKVAKRFDLKVWGPGWAEWSKQLSWGGRPLYGHDFATVCSSAKIVLGINPQTARGATNYTSERTWMVIQAGGLYLGQATDGITSLLREGDHCAWYKDLESCLERCAYYLANPATRERVRLQGQHFVAEHHTYDQRIHNLLAAEEFVNPLGL
jgi:glycosyl transferase family 1